MSELPYKKIAVAVAFSPRFAQVLAEAKRMRDRIGTHLDLIYVGEQNDQTDAKFQGILGELELPLDSRIHYHQGDPATAILTAASVSGAEVIVAGALEKEVVLHPFLGNVARRLVRDAPSSVILFTKPAREPLPFRRIVFMAEYTPHGRAALRKAIHLASREGTETLYVIRVYTTFDAARARRSSGQHSPEEGDARTLEEEEAALEEFILCAGPTPVPIEARCVRGNTNFAAADFIQSVQADLLVVPVEKGEAGTGLPAHAAWLTEVIPCNLWVVR